MQKISNTEIIYIFVFILSRDVAVSIIIITLIFKVRQ